MKNPPNKGRRRFGPQLLLQALFGLKPNGEREEGSPQVDPMLGMRRPERKINTAQEQARRVRQIASGFIK